MTEILSDIIPTSNTVLLIVGESVGRKSAELGHYYADVSNAFWGLLSNLTGKTLNYYDDEKVIEYGIGLTDIIKDKIGLEEVDEAKIDSYYDKFIDKVKEIKPKIILFNSMFSYKSPSLSPEEIAIRKKLNKRTKKFIQDYKYKYIILQHISSSGSAYSYTLKRKKQWENLATIYNKIKSGIK